MRGLGWGLVLLAAAAVVVALATGGALALEPIVGLPSGPATRRAAGALHGLSMPVVRCGVLGFALLQLARRPIWRPAAVGIGLGAAVALPGALLAAWGDAGWGMSGPSWLPGMGLAVAGSGLVGVAVSAAVVHRRRWPEPLVGGLVAVGVLVVVLAIDVGPVFLRLWLDDPMGFWMWPNPSRSGPWRLATGVMACGAALTVVRVSPAPAWIDAGVCLGLTATVLAGLWLPLTAQPTWVASALAAGVAVTAGLAYAVAAWRRGALALHVGQPLVVLMAALWAVGLASEGVRLATAVDVFWHDTYAEVASLHLLDGLLVTLAGLAAATGRVPDPTALGPWLGVGLASVVTGFGALRVTLALWALGAQGMPRTAGYAPPGMTGWEDLALGGAITGLGLAGLLAMVAWATVRTGGRPAAQRWRSLSSVLSGVDHGG